MTQIARLGGLGLLAALVAASIASLTPVQKPGIPETRSEAPLVGPSPLPKAEPGAASLILDRSPFTPERRPFGRDQAPPPAPVDVRLTGIFTLGGKRQASLMVGGQPSSVREGDQTAAGRITKIEPTAVELEGETTFERSGSPDSRGVQDDWAVVRIRTSDAIGASNTELVRQSLPEEVSVVGYFSDHTAQRYGPGASKEDWKRGLRWPLPGLCHAYMAENRCVRMVCETVRGFSGAPVFDIAASDPSKPLRVIGFVSGADFSPDAGCGAPNPNVTIAIDASVIGP